MAPEMTIAEGLSYSTLRLDVKLRNGRVGNGTGFIYKFEDGGKYFLALVTCRHIFEGGVSIRFHITRAEGNGPGTAHDIIDIDDIQSYWLPHPDPTIDLAVMPLGPLFHALDQTGSKPYICLLEEKNLARPADLSELSPGDEILMIGYPNGIWDEVNNMPIFRRGILATHAAKNYNGNPEFLIDAACFPGSSGSPVFLHRFVYVDRRLNRLAWDTSGRQTKLLGILHSGPQYVATGELEVVTVNTASVPVSQTPLMLNLGIVVRAEKLVDFIPILRTKFVDNAIPDEINSFHNDSLAASH
jgi:Trypsin-like peptidase domain